ncbi:RagB/SusD family nutrient uptake outer membrane protein [Pedobacter sp. MR2016-24]|uniref:RagB/SusD family nutrient uptake outer membrane protein n=1 Tax=Pedobacter sp. MR2016-24 TaxID=2994466 RepID=UPI002245C566|nr:RagB/SusD family nutrient uptake outer membrane protein [Pedobacter sp. MR2016-24]MCX2486211.1 RagB/SusD family nutrient uptake outer membrane protein [Pedobacter sp. MR2016-24]
MKITHIKKMNSWKNSMCLLVLLVLSSITPSCKKFLEVDPISEIPADKMWKSQRDVNAGLAEMYSSFRIALNANYFSWGEMRSDNFVLFSEQPTENGKLILNQLTTDLVSANWNTLYKVISNANFAIKNIPDADITDAVLKNDYLAQAYAMRALSYFYAVRVWGDVPVYLDPIDNIDKGEFRPRTAMKTVLRDHILADLKMAEQLINPGNLERKRLSRNAIYAIQADVYMWLEDYDSADKTIDKLRSNVTYTNFQPDMSLMKKQFVEDLNNKVNDNDPTKDEYGPATNEMIFVIHQNVSEAGLSNYSLIWLLLGSGSGQGSTVVLSPKLQAIYTAANAATPRDNRFENYLAPSGGGTTTYQVHKYIANGTSLPYQNFVNCQMAYPVYRFTDILLMQAEAKAQLDKWQDALDIIRTTVRTRAGVAASTRPLSSFSSREQVVDYVLNERQIELVGEGKRWFDLVRTKRAVKVMQPINGMSNVNQTLFPINQSLINQNKALVQNPGY